MSLIEGSDDKSGTPPVVPSADGAATTPPADWTAALTPEMKTVVENKGYKTPADVLNAYVHAEKLIGADKIPLPKDGVWDATARAKLGIPETPDKYEVKRPEMPDGMVYDEGFEKTALAKAHALGLTPAQVNGLLEVYAQQRGNEFSATAAGQAQMREETAAALGKEWGKAYPVKLEAASRAARSLGGDSLIEALNSSGAGNNPEIVRAFAKIGAMLGEDKMKAGMPAGFGLTPEEARAEANKLMSTDAYRNGQHVEHGDTVKKVQALFQQAHPEEG